MRNFLIWNGTNSETISGLIIQELPPITKPKTRTQITEIDGKDGDFTDELGFGSYEKEVKIGLFRDYDINQIAKYFTGSGQVIFSNEPDKYYNAAIYEQIDFERLITFKEATVKFHCQPYKYLVNEPVTDVTIGEQTEISVINQGLETSKPIMILTGSGIIEISVNGLAQFQYDFGNDTEVTIDSESEDAYMDTPLNLKNRQMTGQFPILNPGENIISWTGNLTEIKVHPNSRWL
ncbi:MAG: phage tail family protein [Oscillospiraceae bacterium]|jgi:predicted phage tail component-like protein|nr:phage tail family protein [Oscillospiraceae bacterium]